MANNLDVKDASGVTQTLKPNDSAGVHTPHHLEDAAQRTALLTAIDLLSTKAKQDTLAALIGEVQASPTANTVLDRLKTLATSLTTLQGYVDNMEGYTDGLETLVTATNSALTTIQGYLDGVETLIGTTNTTLTTLDGHVDGLEGLITTLNGYVDGLETLVGTTNTTLSTLDGHVDGLEGLVTTLNGYVDGLETLLGGTLTVGGNVAHDGVDSGNPVKIGAKAIAALSGTTLVAAADRADAQSDLDGALLMREHGAIGDYVSGNASNTDGNSTQVIAAAGAGVKVHITDVTITNMSSTDIYVELKDGTTVMWTFPVPQKGGVTHSFRTPLKGSANTAWNFDPSAAATTVYCSISGFKSKI